MAGWRQRHSNDSIYQWIIGGAAVAIVGLLGLVYWGIQAGIEQNRKLIIQSQNDLLMLRHLAIEAHPEIARILLSLNLELPTQPLSDSDKREIFAHLLTSDFVEFPVVPQARVEEVLAEVERLTESQRASIANQYSQVELSQHGVVWTQDELNTMYDVLPGMHFADIFREIGVSNEALGKTVDIALGIATLLAFVVGVAFKLDK